MIRDIIIVISVTMFVTFFIWWLQQLSYNFIRCFIPWYVILAIGFATMFGLYYLINKYKYKDEDESGNSFSLYG